MRECKKALIKSWQTNQLEHPNMTTLFRGEVGVHGEHLKMTTIFRGEVGVHREPPKMSPIFRGKV